MTALPPATPQYRETWSDRFNTVTVIHVTNEAANGIVYVIFTGPDAFAPSVQRLYVQPLTDFVARYRRDEPTPPRAA